MTASESKDHAFVSKEFDDIYFSKEDGVEETKFVFLKGNQIYDRWQTKGTTLFRIGELGFGTGLNFFVTKSEWNNIPEPPPVEFFSLEKFPLPIHTLQEMSRHFPTLLTWDEKILESYSSFLSYDTSYANGSNCFEWSYDHPISDAKFKLKLYLGDVKETIHQFEKPIDCFYLDGFAPKKNPQMWTDEVIGSIRNLSNLGTSFATFTSAGFVKRNLQAAGFSVTKQSGYGRKREMLVGQLDK